LVVVARLAGDFAAVRAFVSGVGATSTTSTGAIDSWCSLLISRDFRRAAALR